MDLYHTLLYCSIKTAGLRTHQNILSIEEKVNVTLEVVATEAFR